MALTNTSETASSRTEERFYVVGMGASAGGLEALRELLHALPAHTGMAFVVVQHLEPSYISQLVRRFCRARLRCESFRP
jgi:two-component system, chemotaxis family, CheB/CheR fusion protein